MNRVVGAGPSQREEMLFPADTSSSARTRRAFRVAALCRDGGAAEPSGVVAADPGSGSEKASR